MKKPALFIIDMVNDCFVHKPLIARRPDLCAAINELLAFARDQGFHVIWVRQEFEQDLRDAFLEMRDENIAMYIKGTPGAAMLEELQPKPDELEIIKKRYSMFFGTDLDDVLNRLNPSMLVLAGVNTHACIRMAAIDAYQRDYRTVIVRECVASADEEHHEVSLQYLGHAISKIVALSEFKRMVAPGPAA